MESSEMISAPIRSASAIPTAVLPTAVAPVKNQQSWKVVVITSAETCRRGLYDTFACYTAQSKLDWCQEYCCVQTMGWKGNRIVNSPTRPLDELERTIAERAANPSSKSYTTQLINGGVEAIGAKIVEEAMEVVEAAGEAGDTDRQHFLREAGDLVYHLM